MSVARRLVCGLVGAGLVLASAGVDAAQVPAPTALVFSARDTGNDLWVVTISARRFTSRDDVEGRLLLETARLVQTKGKTWFALVPRPGEGAGTHPLRETPFYGAKYANWHAQWYYELEGERWQPWRPEWGARFWASAVDLNRLTAFEAHALVQTGERSADLDGDLFEAATVMIDLVPSFAPAASSR